jgi:hypothetical protein
LKNKCSISNKNRNIIKHKAIVRNKIL